MTYNSLHMEALLVAFVGYRTFAHQVLLLSAIMPKSLSRVCRKLKKLVGKVVFK